MKIWMLVAIVGLAGILALASFAIVNTVQSDDVEQTENPTCSAGCGNSCTAENNCGRATCGAVSGGSCGCS